MDRWQTHQRWSNRRAAGLALAQRLSRWRDRANDTTVIGLPRGGIAVAAAVAEELGLPCASWAVRKLALPSQPEYAVGAIAAGDVVVWNPAALISRDLGSSDRQQLIERERGELLRRQQRFGDPPATALHGRHLIVVDDGIATGMTVLAALQSLRQLCPAELVLAVPVLDREVLPLLTPLVDVLVAAEIVTGLDAVGSYYQDFSQLGDAEVLTLLERNQLSTPPQT